MGAKNRSVLASLKGIEAGYGELQILKGVDITICPGEIVALIGPNGAGKSTVLKTIFGITKIQKGSVCLKNEDITGIATHQLLARGISYVPQGRINFGELTVKENLELGAAHLPLDRQLKAIKSVFKRFPALERKAQDYAFSLSGGQQQMLAIGRALLHEPTLLLMDEPSLGLSPKLQTELFDIITKLRNEGIAILVVEQNAKKAIEIADRTYLLEQGKVALSGGREIIKNKKIKEVYLGS